MVILKGKGSFLVVLDDFRRRASIGAHWNLSVSNKPQIKHQQVGTLRSSVNKPYLEVFWGSLFPRCKNCCIPCSTPWIVASTKRHHKGLMQLWHRKGTSTCNGILKHHDYSIHNPISNWNDAWNCNLKKDRLGMFPLNHHFAWWFLVSWNHLPTGSVLHMGQVLWLWGIHRGDATKSGHNTVQWLDFTWIQQ